MKHVVCITFSSSKNNFEAIVDFFGVSVRVSKFGADFDPKLMEKLLRQFDNNCDVIAVSGFHPPVKVGRRLQYHPDSQHFVRIPEHTPVVTGFLFKDTFVPWAVQEQVREGKVNFSKKRVSFFSGLIQQELALILSQYTNRIYFADPYFHFKVPFFLRGIEELDSYARRTLPLLKHLRLKSSDHQLSFKSFIQDHRYLAFKNSDYFVATATSLARMDLRFLRGKTVILDSLTSALERELRKVKVKDVLHLVPKLGGKEMESRISYAIMEGLIHCTSGKDEALNEDDILDFITRTGMKPGIHSMSGEGLREARKFAFIVHPLSIPDLFRHPVLKPFKNISKLLEKPLEKAISMVPAVKYGKITGIVSESTGVAAEGIIYTLFDTPRQLLGTHPQKVYDKLVRVAEQAASEGADIVGLGAFTKVVGDAGVTVARQSPIPVTTGNSLSAAATLWAARVVAEKMGFFPAFHADQKRLGGTAMVVGATGSIGKVCAKLLLNVVNRMILCAPNGHKLIELRDELSKSAPGPGVKIEVATSPNRFAPDCDLIVVSTSAVEGGVLDIMSVKPGCVVTDVSRPVSFSKNEMIKRPDVLIVESGEVVLPGNVEISCDIGLERSVVYACLAETALLALEGRLESFTLSKNISYEKVREIYDIAKKHGAKLATIRGPMGVITDQEIELCKEHVLKTLPLWKQNVARTEINEGETLKKKNQISHKSKMLKMKGKNSHV